MDSIKLNTNLTENEFYEHKKELAVKGLFTKRYAILLFMTFMVVVVLLMDLRDYTEQGQFLGPLTITVLAHAVFFGISLYELKSHAASFVNGHSLYSKEKIDLITESGIGTNYKGSMCFFEWSEFSKIVETKSIIEIRAKDSHIAYISKSAFNTQKELDFFNECTASIKRG